MQPMSLMRRRYARLLLSSAGWWCAKCASWMPYNMSYREAKAYSWWERQVQLYEVYCADWARTNNNNNNTLIYIAPACRMTSEAQTVDIFNVLICKADLSVSRCTENKIRTDPISLRHHWSFSKKHTPSEEEHVNGDGDAHGVSAGLRSEGVKIIHAFYHL